MATPTGWKPVLQNFLKFGAKNRFLDMIEPFGSPSPTPGRDGAPEQRVGAEVLPDEMMGQIPAAFVVLAPGVPPPSAQEIKRHCNSNLPRHKALRAVHIVDRLPKTPSGKVRRGELVAGVRAEAH